MKRSVRRDWYRFDSHDPDYDASLSLGALMKNAKKRDRESERIRSWRAGAGERDEEDSINTVAGEQREQADVRLKELTNRCVS